MTQVDLETTDRTSILRRFCVRAGYRFEGDTAVSLTGLRSMVTSVGELERLARSCGYEDPPESKEDKVLSDHLRRAIAKAGYRFEGDFAVSPSGARTGIARIPDLLSVLSTCGLTQEDVLEAISKAKAHIETALIKRGDPPSKAPAVAAAPASRVSTPLDRSPFTVLGATVRDNEARIIELSDERSLTGDSTACAKARSELINVRTRLAAELRWLPGLSPSTARILVADLKKHIELLTRPSSAPPLAKANLMAAACELLGRDFSVVDWRDWIIGFAEAVAAIEPEAVRTCINEDRSVSGFPVVRGLAQIQSELVERRRYYVAAVRDAVDRLPSDLLLRVIDTTIVNATLFGEKHAPQLIHEIVERYEIEARPVLRSKLKGIEKLIAELGKRADEGGVDLTPWANKLDALVREWGVIAHPINVSMKAQGLEYEASKDVARAVRRLALRLFQEHDQVRIVQQLTDTQRAAFRGLLPSVADQITEDLSALADAAKQERIRSKLLGYKEEVTRCIEAVDSCVPRGERATAGAADALISKLRKCEHGNITGDADFDNPDFRSSVAWDARSCAVRVFNEHDFLDTAQQLTRKLREIFGDLTKLDARLKDDLKALDEIRAGRAATQARAEERDREITYHAEIGLVLKETVRISPRGIEYKGKRVLLEHVTSVRWGAVSTSVNGISTGTYYTIEVGSRDGEIKIDTRRQEVYGRLTDSIWKGACGRLITEHLAALKAGQRLTIGEAEITDNGIVLTRHRLFGNERVYCDWQKVDQMSWNGALKIWSTEDQKVYVELPYLKVDNAHILEAMIRLSKENWKGRLSGLLQ